VIVFITISWFLPAYKAGGPIQSIANLVENFADDIQYKIFCSNVDLDNTVLQNIEFDKWIPFSKNTDVFYASPTNVTKKLKLECNNIAPNVLFIIGLFSLKYNIFPLLFCNAKKKILSVRGMLHAEALSQKKWKKKLFLLLFKIFGIKNKIVFHATNKEEKEFIQYQFGNKVVINIADNFPKKVKEGQPLFKQAGSLKLITIALISPMKNHLLVLQALESVTANIEYNIYGPIKDAHYWDGCLQQIKKMPSNVAVKYHGEIPPTNVQNALAENHVFIMPSKSENFAHSIAEALGMGKPIITSNGTPWNMLKENNAGENVDTKPTAIFNAIHFFAALDNDEYLQSSLAAISYFEKKVNIQNLKQQYQILLCS
jgi:glycosyltransferase involved in cell wall biosynthesis